MPGEILTIREVSVMTGLSPQQIKRRMQSGQIPAEKFGWIWCIRRKDIEHLIEK
jgi:excisionase family DNA binding protein